MYFVFLFLLFLRSINNDCISFKKNYKDIVDDEGDDVDEGADDSDEVGVVNDVVWVDNGDEGYVYLKNVHDDEDRWLWRWWWHNGDVDDEEEVNVNDDAKDGVAGNIEKCNLDGENVRVMVKIVIVKGNLEIPGTAQEAQNGHNRLKLPSVFSFKPPKKYWYRMKCLFKD